MKQPPSPQDFGRNRAYALGRLFADPATRLTEAQRRTALEKIAGRHGLSPEEVDAEARRGYAEATLRNTLPIAPQHTPGIEN